MTTYRACFFRCMAAAVWMVGMSRLGARADTAALGALSYDGTAASLARIEAATKPHARRGNAYAVALCRQAIIGQGHSWRVESIPTRLGKQESEREDADWLAEIEARAEKGEVFFQTALGVMYLTGKPGGKRDPDGGMALIKAASQAGYHDASCKLGIIAEGSSPARAADHYRLAAKQGSSIAAFNLGCLYLHGKGFEENTREAYAWLLKAANKGHVTASDNLRARFGPVGVSLDGGRPIVAHNEKPEPPSEAQRKALASLIEHMDVVEGDRLAMLPDPDGLRGKVLSASSTFNYLDADLTTDRPTFTEARINAHRCGADGFRLRTDAQPRQWALALVVPAHSVRSLCLVHSGDGPGMHLDVLSARACGSGPWPNDCEVIFADLTQSRRLATNETYALAVVPNVPETELRCWVALQGLPQRLNVNGASSPALRASLWRAGFGLQPEMDEESALCKALYHVDFARLGKDGVHAGPLRRLWARYGNALSFALVWTGDLPLVKAVLGHGLDFGATFVPDTTRMWRPAGRHETPLQKALVLGHAEIATALEEYGCALPRDALYDAARAGNATLVNRLIDRGEPVDGRNPLRMPLVGACIGGRPKIVTLLLGRGANLEATKGAALCAAIGRKRPDLITLLLDAGDDINGGREVWPKLPHVFHAIKGCDGDVVTDVLRLLVKRGARMDIRNSAGQTAVEYAVVLHQKSVAAYLRSVQNGKEPGR